MFETKKTKPCRTCQTPTLVTEIYENGNCPTCERLRRKTKDLPKPKKVDVKTLEAPEDILEPDTEVFVQSDRERLKAEQEARFNQKQEAQREAAERELCRRHLLPYVLRNVPTYDAGWVHADVCKRLEQFLFDVEAKKSPRLMLCLPPRHGKSEIASRNFPGWALGRNPTYEIIQASYASDLALDFSRKVRELMKSPSHAGVFPTAKVDPKSAALERWNTTLGGAYAAVGVNGPITGRGMHIGIIDDPVKSRAEAESEVIRQQIKDWYSSTFYTRLAPGGGIVVIMTRWHEDDLAGWLTTLMEEAERECEETGEWPKGADKWDIIKYPAIAEEDEPFRKKGDALHEGRFPLEALDKYKRTLMPRDWAALYQQRPTLEDGDFFKRASFKYYDRHPPLDTLSIYSAWDFAVGKKESNDYTVCVIVGVDKHDDIYVLEVLRGRWSSLEIIDKMIDVQDRYSPVLQGMEQGHIESSIEPVLIKTMNERKKFIPYEKLKHRGMDKVARAQAIRTRIDQSRVWVPKEGSMYWVQILLDEMVKFPGGKFDDQVDAMAWIGQMLLMYASIREKKEDTTPEWAKRLKRANKRGGSAMSA